MKKELSQPDIDIDLENNSSRLVSEHPAALAVMGDMNVKVVWAENTGGSGVHTVICSPPRNHRRNAELSNLEYDRPSRQDMRHFVKLLFSLMDLGLHGPMLHSALEVKTRNNVLAGEIDKVVKHEQIHESEEPGSQTAIIVEVEAKALHKTPVLPTWCICPLGKRLLYMAFVRLLFWSGRKRSLCPRCLVM